MAISMQGSSLHGLQTGAGATKQRHLVVVRQVLRKANAKAKEVGKLMSSVLRTGRSQSAHQRFC